MSGRENPVSPWSNIIDLALILYRRDKQASSHWFYQQLAVGHRPTFDDRLLCFAQVGHIINILLGKAANFFSIIILMLKQSFLSLEYPLICLAPTNIYTMFPCTKYIGLKTNIIGSTSWTFRLLLTPSLYQGEGRGEVLPAVSPSIKTASPTECLVIAGWA